MTTAAQFVASAETFTLGPARHSRPGTKIGTFVSHVFDEATGTDGTLHQVIVAPIDDDTARVIVGFSGDDVYAGIVDTYRVGRDALAKAVEALVAEFIADSAWEV